MMGLKNFHRAETFINGIENHSDDSQMVNDVRLRRSAFVES